ELADGTTQTSEVYAGSGYYSQSSAAVFFGAPTDNPIRRIRVRWPDGRTTSHDLSGASGTVLYSAP
ncbi:MAG TPA: ASPIC/UnbV domain-containing protein, partial [Opitutus sp.]|nr:ASPIC/UnbV domain-containing protein [Opitutus sp.]